MFTEVSNSANFFFLLVPVCFFEDEDEEDGVFDELDLSLAFSVAPGVDFFLFDDDDEEFVAESFDGVLLNT